MQQWLKNFAYQADIGIGVFLASGFLAIGIACLTMSYKSIRAARMNPAKSLRTE
jgi:putative ABC transport system permease protein